jgi:hypothetical protein
MSSECFVVTVLAAADRTLDLRVRTTTAGGPNDYACTRSFALCLIHRPLRGGTRPIDREAATWPEDWYVSEAFMREHVGRYVERTEVLARRNVIDEDDARARQALRSHAELAETMSALDREQHLCGRWHHLDLRVTVTEPRWLEGLGPGMVFGTTAFDVWWGDPRRPEVP